MPTLAELFYPEPTRWGLRGDPGLWAALADRLGALPLPEDEETFAALLSASYAQLTGPDVTPDGEVTVPAFDRGGLSGGRIDAGFWHETALPLLRERYAAARARI